MNESPESWRCVRRGFPDWPSAGLVLAACFMLLLTLLYTPRAHALKTSHEAAFRIAAAEEADDPDSQHDSSRKYRWLFREKTETETPKESEATGVLQKLDREIKEARRLYLSGEAENAILKYRSVLDNFESTLEDVPPGHPLLKEMQDRMQIFDELATKILGPVQTDPREDMAGMVFHLMERRRICKRALVLKKAGTLRFFDVSPALLAEESDILSHLLEIKSDLASPEVRQKGQLLEAKLLDVRKSLQKSSQRYAILRKGVPISLADLQRDFMAKDELILDFNLLPDRMVVGVITAEKALYHQIPADRVEIDKGVFFLQEKLREFALTGRSSFMGHAWKEPARRIYRSILGKLPALPADKTTVLVIPDRSLWYLPFSVMLDPEDRPFGRGRVVSVIPSADMLRLVRSEAGRDLPAGFQGDMLLFEAIPWIPEEEAQQMGSSESPRKKAAKKTSEEEKIERLILSNPVYPKPSEIVVSLQKLFKKFEVWVGPTATLDRLKDYKGRGDYVTLLAAPLSMPDVVGKERQPTLFFAPDKKGNRKFDCAKLFGTPLGARLMVLPMSWFDVQEPEAPAAEGPLLLSTALLYGGVRMVLINYSDPNWGADEPFLYHVLKQEAGKRGGAEAIATYPREMPAALDTSFSGKPPSWTGWILMGDPSRQ